MPPWTGRINFVDFVGSAHPATVRPPLPKSQFSGSPRLLKPQTLASLQSRSHRTHHAMEDAGDGVASAGGTKKKPATAAAKGKATAKGKAASKGSPKAKESSLLKQS